MNIISRNIVCIKCVVYLVVNDMWEICVVSPQRGLGAGVISEPQQPQPVTLTLMLCYEDISREL